MSEGVVEGVEAGGRLSLRLKPETRPTSRGSGCAALHPREISRFVIVKNLKNLYNKLSGAQFLWPGCRQIIGEIFRIRLNLEPYPELKVVFFANFQLQRRF